VDPPTKVVSLQLFLSFPAFFVVFVIDAGTLSQFYGYRTLSGMRNSQSGLTRSAP
jgi:hypothetical protein